MTEIVQLRNTCTGPTYKEGFLVLDESFRGSHGEETPIPHKGEFIVDIMIVIDCYEGQRVPHSPILIRLENFDLVISGEENAVIRAWAGSVNNQLPICIASRETVDDSGCLIWITDKSAIGLLGETLEHIRVEGTAKSNLVICARENGVIRYSL